MNTVKLLARPKWIISFATVLFGFAPIVSASPSDLCSLPQGLDSKITARSPGAHVVSLADLDDYDKKLYTKDHGAHCPGLVRVNFYGDGKPTWALVLLSGYGQTSKAELVVARKLDTDWEIRSIHSLTSSGTPVVWREPAGKYEGVWGDKTIHARNPVIIFCAYESWAVVYAWNGKAVEEVQMSD